MTQNKYLKEQVKCESKAQYYYTCKCGKIGTTWFEYGDKLDHSYTNYIYNNTNSAVSSTAFPQFSIR